MEEADAWMDTSTGGNVSNEASSKGVNASSKRARRAKANPIISPPSRCPDSSPWRGQEREGRSSRRNRSGSERKSLSSSDPTCLLLSCPTKNTVTLSAREKKAAEGGGGHYGWEDLGTEADKGQDLQIDTDARLDVWRQKCRQQRRVRVRARKREKTFDGRNKELRKRLTVRFLRNASRRRAAGVEMWGSREERDKHSHVKLWTVKLNG